jgi:catechol 2,3-dioxygenase-like lactoylglutathione lyase family enzyme
MFKLCIFLIAKGNKFLKPYQQQQQGKQMKKRIGLDHIIVNVNDIGETFAFWSKVFGFESEGQAGPFTVMRITPDLTFQFAPWGTEGGSHFAFALPKHEFLAVLQILRDNDIPYGDSFHTVGNQQGPGEEDGARGMGKAIYFNDPNEHLLEICTYDEI